MRVPINDLSRQNGAIEEALNSPLLGEIDLRDARGCMIRVSGGPDMTVTQAEQAAEIVGSRINKRARIIWGCNVDPNLEGTIKILLIVTGAKSKYMIGKNAAVVKMLAGVTLICPRVRLL